jgi:hypothetical protein
MSISKKAAVLAINIVNDPTIMTKIFKFNLTRSLSKRKSRYTPAVTKVEECTNEETGVGAAIAAGSQALNGICALFVREANITTTIMVIGLSLK